MSAQRFARHAGRGVLILAFATLGMAIAASARIATGTLAGMVLDAHGKPVAGAIVTIQTSDGRQPHATHTDAAGRFAFARYSAGQYDLNAQFRGDFSDWTKRIAIHAGKTTNITLRLQPPRESTAARP